MLQIKIKSQDQFMTVKLEKRQNLRQQRKRLFKSSTNDDLYIVSSTIDS